MELTRKEQVRRNMLKAIILLALPAMVENILQVLLGFVDTYFISILGKEAIAAVGVTNLIMNIYIAFFQAIGVGTTAIITRNIGAKNIDKVNETIEQSILFSLFISITLGIISLIFSRRILHLLGIEANVLDYALPYFISVAVPSVFLSLMTTLSSILRAMGDTKSPMKATFISNIINVVLNYILMFGIYNIKGIGILGVGIATTVSRIIGTFILFKVLRNFSEEIEIKNIFKFRYNKNTLLGIIKIGGPAGLEKLIMRSGQLVYGRFIIGIGVSSYAAHNIAGQIEMCSYLPAMAFGVSSATLIGQSLGENNPEKAEKYGDYAYIISVIFMVIIGGLFGIFAPQIVSYFTDDKEVIFYSVRVLRIIAMFQPFLAVTQVTAGSLQGAGDTKFPMYLTFIGMWGIMVFGVYLMNKMNILTLVGVWSMYALDITFRGIILMIRYKKGKWKELEI